MGDTVKSSHSSWSAMDETEDETGVTIRPTGTKVEEKFHRQTTWFLGRSDVYIGEECLLKSGAWTQPLFGIGNLGGEGLGDPKQMREKGEGRLQWVFSDTYG